jgi:hypothetical protein
VGALGGKDKANALLNHFTGTTNVDATTSSDPAFINAQNVLSPGGQPRTGGPALTYVPSQGNFSSSGTWTGPSFTTYVGTSFANFDLSTQATVEMHEFIHASMPNTWINRAMIDMSVVNQQGMSPNRTANIYTISKKCGTKLPPGF